MARRDILLSVVCLWPHYGSTSSKTESFVVHCAVVSSMRPQTVGLAGVPAPELGAGLWGMASVPERHVSRPGCQRGGRASYQLCQHSRLPMPHPVVRGNQPFATCHLVNTLVQ